ncbi:hypothetical protein Cs7R123_07420 [Catellatospora sp. TT07R-123]|uniref:FtsX-like permease family protein n=1 Tax=Catellatospora sp. TT07R-123 TaxID=2733863 RepID=UPI001B095715|nr:FtsX-like permease family protein [Catellatospora sp. TT07R-123]GHJ43400.1 hypothetical protein Cs7R123_07420 [Catellatospora sp. TT07R-123]
MITLWLRGLLRHRPGRTAGAATGVAAAVALLACLGMFLAGSQASMTARAAARIAVDWQVQVTPGSDPAAVRQAVAAQPGTVTTAAVGYATVPGLSATTASTNHRTGQAVALGLPDGYRADFPGQLRTLAGSDQGVLLAQQTAANLHAVPGTTITITRPGLPDAAVTVAGIVDLPQANALFQTVGAPTGAQPAAPPDNVLLLPAADYADLIAPIAAADPSALSVQIHATRDHHLPRSPAQAYLADTRAAQHLAADLAGGGQVGDNLAATLDAARSDAAYATVLLLFLGLPGAVLAATVTAIIAAAGAASRRRDHALARARGATTRQLLKLAAAETLLIAACATVAGLAAAAALGQATTGDPSWGAAPADAALWSAAAAAAALVIALAAVLLPTWRQVRNDTVHAAYTTAPAHRLPHPALIVLLAVAGALIWHQTSGTGYQLVLAPEGVAAISVDYWAFTAPALLWLAAALTTYRLTHTLLGRGRALTALLRPWTRQLAPVTAATLTRNRHLIAQTVTVLALTLAFAATTATFNTTYRAQADVDARLTNGADVTVTTTGTADLSAISGVSHVEPLQHRYAYIGSDLQDMYGVNAATIIGTGLQDSWFTGGTAADLMQRLARQPDAVLVSAETVTDYQLRPGDTITLRIPSAASTPATAVFHYIGTVAEFPTAPKDSFFVANAAYLDQVADPPANHTYLLTTTAAPPQVAATARDRLGPAATVTDLTTTAASIGSSLTAVDLGTLTTIELSFALLLTATAAGLLPALTLTERRRTFTLAALLGASRRQLTGFVAAEACAIGVLAALFGAGTAAVITAVLLAALTGVFDPPPDHPHVAWTYLAVVVVVTVVSLCAAAVLTVVRCGRIDTSVIRRDAG